MVNEVNSDNEIEVNEVDSENDSSNQSENGIEIDLAFYENVEDFDLSGGRCLICNGPCPKKLRKLRLSRLESLILPSNLSHLHLLHLHECYEITSLHGLGSIPNIRLSYLPDLTFLEGLGPGNQFAQSSSNQHRGLLSSE